MHGENISYAYGFWFLVLVNVALFGFFILSFLTPFKKREWRAMGVTLGFFVALFTEMYGIPLTIYILTAILGSRYPALNPFSHASGHLWLTFIGGGALMMTVIHIISNGLTVIGFVIMWKGWKLIHDAKDSLVTGGALRLCETPPVFRTLCYHDRDAYPVAHNHHSPDVSCARLYILPPVKERRGGDDQDLRG